MIISPRRDAYLNKTPSSYLFKKKNIKIFFHSKKKILDEMNTKQCEILLFEIKISFNTFFFHQQPEQFRTY